MQCSNDSRMDISGRPTGVVAVANARRLRSTFMLTVLFILVLLVPGAIATTKGKHATNLAHPRASSGGESTVYTITGCSECTVNLSQRWCPATMRCYPADNCTCDGPVPCIGLQTCFYGSRPRCQECVDSGGVYCSGGASVLTPNGRVGVQQVRCYPPAYAPQLDSSAEESKKKGKALTRGGAGGHEALPVCDESTCPGGACIRAVAQCPAEVFDPLTRSYEIICAVAVVGLTFLVFRNICRLAS